MADFFQHENALVHPGARVGRGTRIWAFTNIQEGAVIGDGCNICDGCFVEGGAVVGNHVTLKNGVYVFKGVTLEDDVFCGAQTSFINDRFPRSHRKDQWILEETRVKRGATIGSGSTLLCGLTVGEFAFIGAGSVVTHDVGNHMIVWGNPAKVQGFACQCGQKLSAELVCGCGLVYQRSGDGLSLRE